MGVVLGASGLAVVEDDTRGRRTTKLLELLGGELPPTPIVSQRRQEPAPVLRSTAASGNAVRDGLELRCGRQQCVLPPSVHPETGRAVPVARRARAVGRSR